MNKRIWDKEGKYKDGFVKEYKHWVLEISYHQHTLGCFIIFAKRKIERISELKDEEVIELKEVMSELETTLSNMEDFKPDRFNYLQMGNALHHLHFHVIPRYETSRHFMNKEWNDITFGHPPIWSKVTVDNELVLKIKGEFLSQPRPLVSRGMP